MVSLYFMVDNMENKNFKVVWNKSKDKRTVKLKIPVKSKKWWEFWKYLLKNG